MAGITKVHYSTVANTNLGGRDLQMLVIAQTGIETNYSNISSNFQKTLYALQQFTELFMVGTPASGLLTVGVASTTIESLYDSVTNSGSYPGIATAILAATGVSTTVYAGTLSGAAFTYGP
jgi:hypothetical protein